jgi:hypothetical protein
MVLRANHPDDHVISAISRGDERRPASEPPAPVHTPPTGDRWWIGCSNAESKELDGASATSNIRSLVSTVRGRPLVDRLSGDIEGGYRRGDAAEVTAVK